MKIPTVRNEEMSNKVWIKRKNNYECGIAPQAQNNSSSKWYVDNDCSKHMTDKKNDF